MRRNNPICPDCGHPLLAHEIDQYSGERIKCPVYRQEDPPSPTGRY